MQYALSSVVPRTSGVHITESEETDEPSSHPSPLLVYSDTPLVPPYGPDDGGHPDPDEPDMKSFESYQEYKAAIKLRAAARHHKVASTVAELIA